MFRNFSLVKKKNYDGGRSSYEISIQIFHVNDKYKNLLQVKNQKKIEKRRYMVDIGTFPQIRS